MYGDLVLTHRLRSRRAAGMALALLASASAVVAPQLLGAQTMRYGVVMDAARDSLSAQWSEDPRQEERTYCVTQWWAAVPRLGGRMADDGTDDTLFRVLELRPVRGDASPNGASFTCPIGEPEMHTHPPATCYADRLDQCYPGGTDAYSCQPSREDVRELLRRGDRFAILQCDRHAFVFYYPREFATVASAAPPEPRIRDPYMPSVSVPVVSKP